MTNQNKIIMSMPEMLPIPVNPLKEAIIQKLLIAEKDCKALVTQARNNPKPGYEECIRYWEGRTFSFSQAINLVNEAFETL